MSENSRGEDELQDLLAGKSALSRSYRESSQDQPPANVDAAVLAAARWAVGADSPPGVHALPRATLPRRRKSFLDWGVPLATAAVVVVAVALTYSIERDPAITEIYEKYDRDVLATLGVEPNSAISEDDSRQGESVVPESLSAPESSSTPASPAPPKQSEPVTVAEVPKAVVAPKEVVVPKEVVPQKLPVAKSEPAPKRAVVAPPSRTNEDAVLKKKLLEQREIAERKRRQQSESAAVARSAVEAGKDDKGSVAPLIAEQQFSSVVAANESAAETRSESEPGRLDALADLREEQGKDVAEQEISGRVSEMPVATPGMAMRQELPGPSLGAAQSMSDEMSPADSPRALAETVRDPDDWIQDIEKLLSDGRRDEALKSLKEFRSEYPDYSVPNNLRSLESAESE